jgi:hypothetical protein
MGTHNLAAGSSCVTGQGRAVYGLSIDALNGGGTDSDVAEVPSSAQEHAWSGCRRCWEASPTWERRPQSRSKQAMNRSSTRHHSFTLAQRRGELSLQQLWLSYVALTGACAMVEIDAFLHGLTWLPAVEEDKLAHALNERLNEVYLESRLPYVATDMPAECL